MLHVSPSWAEVDHGWCQTLSPSSMRRSSTYRLPPRLSFNSLLVVVSSSPHPVSAPSPSPPSRSHTTTQTPSNVGQGHSTPIPFAPLLCLSFSCGASPHACSQVRLARQFLRALHTPTCYGGSDWFLDARSLFNESSTKNGVFGNAVLAVYIAAGKWAPALEFVRWFCELGLQVDGYTMTVVV
jgi:hypothetical protein